MNHESSSDDFKHSKPLIDVDERFVVDTKEPQVKENKPKVINNLPIVELGSGNLFEDIPIIETNPFSKDEQYLLEHGKQIILMIDVEACDAMKGTVLAIGCVLGVYSDYMKYHILRREQWIIQRQLSDCSQSGREFWSTQAFSAWTYLTHGSSQKQRLSESKTATSFRQFMNTLWQWIPRLSIMIDNVHADSTLLNNMLIKHKYAPFHYDHRGNYKPNVYVSRDILRGAYAAIDPTFSVLQQGGLHGAITECWNTIIGQDYPFQIGGPPHDVNSCGPAMKHLPVHDAVEALCLVFRMEDIRFFYEKHFPRATYKQMLHSTAQQPQSNWAPSLYPQSQPVFLVPYPFVRPNS